MNIKSFKFAFIILVLFLSIYACSEDPYSGLKHSTVTGPPDGGNGNDPGIPKDFCGVSSVKLPFGEVEVDSRADMEFTVLCPSDALFDISVSGNGFSSAYSSIAVADKVPATVSVSFSPLKEAEHFGTVLLRRENGEEYALELHGTGIRSRHPAVSCSLSALSKIFGDVIIGKSSSETFSISCDKDTLASLSISGNAGFTIESSAEFPIPAGTNADIRVSFAPVSAGNKSDVLSVIYGNEGKINVSLEGRGIEPPAKIAVCNVSPDPLNFGTVTVGSKESLTAAVTCDEDAALKITSSGEGFSLSASQPSSISVKKNQNVSVNLDFVPVSAGDKTGSLSAAVAGGTTKTAVLLGMGKKPPTPSAPICSVISFDSAVLFGEVFIGSKISKSGIIKCTEKTVLKLNVSGDMGFSILPSQSSLNIGANGVQSPKIFFSPSSAGDKSGLLNITDDRGNIYKITLSGKGVINASADSFDIFKPFDNKNLYFGYSAFNENEKRAYMVILEQLLDYGSKTLYKKNLAVPPLEIYSYYIKIDLEAKGISGLNYDSATKILAFIRDDESRVYHLNSSVPRMDMPPGYTPTPPVGVGNSRDDLKHFYLEIKYEWNEYRSVSQAIEGNVEQILAKIKVGPSYTDAQKIKILHDVYLARVGYGGMSSAAGGDLRGSFYETSSDGSGMYKVVCEGYSRAYLYLLQRAGIPAIYTGGATPSVNAMHAWNKVKLDGKWYNTDATWDDSFYGSSIRYFMKTDAQFGKDHNEQKDLSGQPVGYVFKGEVTDLPPSAPSERPASDYDY